MSTAPEQDTPERTPPRRVSGWVRLLVAEIARGRHVILHGNIHDVVRWQGGFVPLRTALTEILGKLSYELVGRYDQVDGLSFAAQDGHRLFAELIGTVSPAAPEEGTPAAGPPGDADGTGSAAPGTRGSRADDLQRRMRQNLSRGENEPRYRQPADALAAVRRGLAQELRPAAFVLDFAELLLLEPDHHDRQDRDLLLLTKKMMLESGRANGAQVHNLLVLVVPDLASLPPWLHRDEPFVRAVEVPLPSYQERLGYLSTIAGTFHGARRSDDPVAAVQTLANLTDGMALAELGGLGQTSRVERVPLSEPRELVKRALFGQQDDPWARLVNRIPVAARQLEERVIGQPAAVRAVGRALAAGTLNVDFVSDPHSVEARPKGVFFFAGPTGVGKTELARALSEVIFDDETALTRFDMSTFAEKHSAERLTGAPPGYVGHERGGELTNHVMSKPFSVLLFDEIEKSHVAVFDKFLQILEDGRLTDGLGRTAYFSQSLIIFTSNVGATPLYQLLQKGELPTYQEVSEIFHDEVSRHFATQLNRPELLGRIGNGVLAFDILRPENIPPITAKFLHQLSMSAQRAGMTLDLEQESITAGVIRQMLDPRSLALGGREIRNILDRSVRAPLIDCVVATGRRTGRFRVELPEDRSVAVVTPGS